MKIQTIAVYVKTIAQKDPKTTKIVIKGAIAFGVAYAAKRGFDLSPDILSFILMAILTWLGVNAADGGKQETTKETVSVTTTSATPESDPATLTQALQNLGTEKPKE
jgi:hypothetical protein